MMRGIVVRCFTGAVGIHYLEIKINIVDRISTAICQNCSIQQCVLSLFLCFGAVNVNACEIPSLSLSLSLLLFAVVFVILSLLQVSAISVQVSAEFTYETVVY